MTCNECQKLIPEYLNNQLNKKELEAFISHVRSCPVCYEELETYFIIALATRVLDESAEVSYDIKDMLEQDLDDKEKTLNKKKRRFILLLAMILLFLILDLILTFHLLGNF